LTADQTWPAPLSSGAGKARKPQKRSGHRRTEIVQAAMAVFAEHGYANGSLSAIASRIGMTHAGVLHHFGSKEQLLVAVLMYRDQADVAELEGARAPRGAAFLDHLVETAEANMKRPGIVQAYTVLLGEAVTENHPARSFFADRFTGLREMVAGAVAEATGRAADDPQVIAAASVNIATMDGLQSQWLLIENAIDIPVAVRLVVDALVRDLTRS
jgi:AcrR family transcriptional regulator